MVVAPRAIACSLPYERRNSNLLGAKCVYTLTRGDPWLLTRIRLLEVYLMVAFLILLANLFYHSGFASGVAFIAVVAHGRSRWRVPAVCRRDGHTGGVCRRGAGADGYRPRPVCEEPKDVIIMACAGSFMMDIVTMIAVPSLVWRNGTGHPLLHCPSRGHLSHRGYGCPLIGTERHRCLLQWVRRHEPCDSWAAWLTVPSQPPCCCQKKSDFGNLWGSFCIADPPIYLYYRAHISDGRIVNLPVS